MIAQQTHNLGEKRLVFLCGRRAGVFLSSAMLPPVTLCHSWVLLRVSR